MVSLLASPSQHHFWPWHNATVSGISIRHHCLHWCHCQHGVGAETGSLCHCWHQHCCYNCCDGIIVAWTLRPLPTSGANFFKILHWLIQLIYVYQILRLARSVLITECAVAVFKILSHFFLIIHYGDLECQIGRSHMIFVDISHTLLCYSIHTGNWTTVCNKYSYSFREM